MNKYKIVYQTPEGEVNSEFTTKEGLAKHRQFVVQTFGESAVTEVSGPDINEGFQLLNEGHGG